MYLSSYFVGSTIGAFTLPSMSDVYGRRKLFLGTNVVTLILMIIELFLPLAPDKLGNIWFLAVLFCLNGIVGSGRRQIGYSYFVELMPRKNVAWMATIWNITEQPLINIYYTLVVLYISKDWKFTCWVVSFLVTASFVGILMFIPESPKWLYAKERYPELQKVLLDLAKNNKVKV